MESTIISTENGTHINGAPLTTSITKENSPELLRNAIDDRIVKIRPMATPIDQLSRCAASRHAGAMKVEFYAVDIMPIETTTSKDIEDNDFVDETGDGQGVTLYIKVNDPDIFSPSETLLLPGITICDSTNPLTLYVIDKDRDKGLFVMAPNANTNSLIKLPAGTKIVRMGRAAAELDVQTAQFESLPNKKSNFCQIFKMQVEQSTFQKLANKEVGWSFSDQEEVAIIDMRMGMEKNFIFGTGAQIVDPEKKQEIYLTRGIWNQTDNVFSYDPDNFSDATLIALSRKAFTGTGGSSRKIIVGGSGFIERLSNLSVSTMRFASSTFVKWGIEFNEIKTNFGTLYVVHSEIFDQCGHEDDAFLIDPAYLTKYCHVPFHTEKLDLRRSGVRNTDAIVITEASCLVLRHPKTHLKIVAKASSQTSDSTQTITSDPAFKNADTES